MGRFPAFNQISAFCDCLSLSMTQSFNFESLKAQIYLGGSIFFQWNGYGHYKPIKFKIIFGKKPPADLNNCGTQRAHQSHDLIKNIKTFIFFKKIPFSTGKSLLFFLRILQASMLANLLAIRDTFSQQTKQQKQKLFAIWKFQKLFSSALRNDTKSGSSLSFCRGYYPLNIRLKSCMKTQILSSRSCWNFARLFLAYWSVFEYMTRAL